MKMNTDPNDGFIWNAWYIAGLSAEFGRKLEPRTFLGENVLIYRQVDGAPVALEDACPHRKLPLSMGKLDGDKVVCGYHGLTFNHQGHCTEAPTQPDAIPKRAKVRCYPTQDQYGFLWIYMGSEETDQMPKIFEIPHFDDPTWATTECGRMEVNCNYIWVIDNLLDPSHVAWVHQGSFAGAGTDHAPLDVEDISDGVIVSRWIFNEPAPPYYRDIFGITGQTDRKQHYECRLPAIAINRSVYAPAGTGGSDENLPPETLVNNSYNFMTPVDQDNTLYFWVQHRNQKADDKTVSARMFEGAKEAFLEDKAVLEAVHRGMRHPATPPINLGLDAGAMRFRRALEKRVSAQRS